MISNEKGLFDKQKDFLLIKKITPKKKRKKEKG